MSKSFYQIMALGVALLAMPSALSAQRLSVAGAAPAAKSGLEVLPRNFKPMPVMSRDSRSVPVPGPTDFSASMPGLRGAMAAPGQGTSVPVYAVCMSSTQWPSYNAAVGIYKLPTDRVPDKLEAEFTDSRLYANAGAVYAGDKLYATNYLVYDYSTILPLTYEFNTEDWSFSRQVDGDITSMSTAMAYDDNTGNIYGCFYTDMGTQMKFGIFNPDTGRSSTIKVLTKVWNACAVSPQGVLYAIDMSGDLHVVDKNTGDMTLVGNTGLNPQYMSGATFDPYSGKLYYVCTSQVDHSSFYEINPSTAEATLLYALPGGEQVAGLFVPNLTSSVEAPAAATDLQAVFDGPALSGQLKFTAPTVTFEGQPLTGMLNYVVRVDGIDHVSGTVEAGAQASANVSVTAAGMHDFAVVLSNDKGSGARAKISAFVGTDTPPAVKNVVLSAENNTLTLTWEPLTVGENGGYIDAANATYTVVRYPEAVTVAQGIKATSFSEAVPASDGVTAFYYTVHAVVGDQQTAPVESNRYVTGAFTAPYHQGFDFGGYTPDNDVINTFTVIDANNDGKTWKYYYLAGYQDGRMSVAYNGNKAMDDWLITPPVYLEANMQYEFSLEASGYDSMNTERYEVKYGRAATVEGMTDMLIEPTTVKVNSETEVRNNKFFIPTESGIYYFGIHGISDAGQFYLFIDDIRISAPKSIDTPAAVSGLTVTPDRNGALKATINCVAPTKTASGADLTELTKIEISRDGQVIATLDNARPGMNVTYIDENGLTNGMHEYSVVAYNAEGMGNPVEASVYVGVNTPAALLGANVELTETVGEVKITWTPSEFDVDGNPLNTELIKYRILTSTRAGEIYMLADEITDTEYYFMAVEPGETQRYINFAIIPYTEAGVGRMTQTDVVAVGPAYTMPFAESFPEHTTDRAFGTNNYDEEQYSSWGFYADNSFDESGLPYTLHSMDNDNGFIGYTASAINGHSGFRSGRIAINNGTAPVFSFGHFVTNEQDDNLIEVVAFLTDGTRKVVKSFAANQSVDLVGSWETVVVPLDEFAGQEIMLEIGVTCTGYAREFFDNLRVYNLMEYNIQAREVEAGAFQSLGKNKVFNVVVENYGTKAADGYTVELLRDGESVGSAAGPALAPGEVAKVAFRQDFSVIDPEQIVFNGVVNFDKDGYTDDNITPDFKVTVLKPEYPTATHLSAALVDGGVKLDWQEPSEIFTTPVAMTEDFESFDAWEYQDLSPWTLYDGDGYINAAFESFVPPFGYTKTSFFVIDNTDTSVIPVEYRTGFAAYSGTKYLSNLPPRGDEGSVVNDWVISPELTGQAQAVSFFVRSYHQTYLETFEVLYSTEEEINPAKFELLARYASVPYNWTQITAELPRDTRYFAIRCVSNNKYMLFVDNVTMITKNGPVDLARRTGYNVYRDGVKINSELITTPSYIEQGAKDDGQSYFVTAVYDKGESVPSTAVNVGQSGLGEAGVATVDVTVEDHTIYVANAFGQPVSIHAVDGRTVFSTVADSTVSATVAPGVYLVQVGRATVKVVVR